MKTKKELDALAHTYTKRIAAAKEKYGVTSPYYRKLYKKLNSKRANWRRTIKLIEKRKTEMVRIDKLVEDFTGFSAKNSVGNKDKNIVLAKNLFMKYAMESGLQAATTLSQWVGLKITKHGNRCRLEFMRTFKRHPENLAAWHRFKEYIQQLEQQQAA